MAEYGIHHATSSGSKPSIFEIIGQENLVHTLRSAFRHVFKVLGENYPVKCGLMYQYFDEGYTVVDSIFQYMHMRLKGGLFSETFYGLKRNPDPRSTDVTQRKVAMWTMLSVVLPYAQSQLESFYKDLQEKDMQMNGKAKLNNFKDYVLFLYLKLYPCCNFVWEATILCYYMAFALGKTKFHSPLMHLANTTLSHQTFVDLSDDAWKQFLPPNQKYKVSTKMWDYMNVFIGGITLTISLGAFLTQFLNWWYSQEGKNTKFMPLPVPPPPRKWPCDDVEICPVCKGKRNNDTALSSSGYVFCYPCIFRFVQSQGRCPVTGYKSSLNQLVKLYHQD